VLHRPVEIAAKNGRSLRWKIPSRCRHYLLQLQQVADIDDAIVVLITRNEYADINLDRRLRIYHVLNGGVIMLNKWEKSVSELP
jgi:hypothetical protein